MAKFTKKELLTTATRMEIVGRHDMTKEELQIAIDEKTVNYDVTEHVGNYVKTPPYTGRRYEVIEKNQEAYGVLAPQAKAIFDFMENEEFVGRGKEIVEAAIAAGVISTRQDGAILFAFYARKLEAAGVMLAE